MSKKYKFLIFSIFFILFIASIKDLGVFFDKITKPVPSDVIVSLGGDRGARIREALRLYDKNYSLSKKIILTGVRTKILDWRIKFLRKHKIKDSSMILNSTAKNTLQEMEFVKKYLLKHHLKSVLVISDPPHSRRILFFANDVLKYPEYNLSIRVIGSKTKWWNAQKYYANKLSLKFVICETLKFSYYYTKYLIKGKL